MDRNNPIGCEINYQSGFRTDYELFNESQSRIIISLSTEKQGVCEEICAKYGINCMQIGTTGGNLLSYNSIIQLGLNKISLSYFDSIKVIMDK